MRKSFFPCLAFLSLGLAILLVGLMAPLPIYAASQTDKLRIFVQPLSGDLPRRAWKFSTTEFVRQQYVITERFLSQKGFYQVIPEGEVRAALKGEEHQAWRWQRGDWALAREVGKHLGADYAMIVERGFQGGRYFRMVLINLGTGKTFDVRDQLPAGTLGLEPFREMAWASYRAIFSQAKGDMLATALRKGRAMPTKPVLPLTPQEGVKEPMAAMATAASPPSLEPLRELPGSAVAVSPAPPAPLREAAQAAPLPVVTVPLPSGPAREDVKESPAPSAVAVAPPREAVKAPSPSTLSPTQPAVPRKAEGRALQMEMPRPPVKTAGGKIRLIVHDFDTGADLQAAGMILAEALREELHQFDRFVLVNREDMAKALEEHKLKMVGLVEEEGSIEVGKWLMASEMITGKLTRLGSTSILQTKRTDIESLSVRNLKSLKSPFGKEEELLDGIPDLARRLFEIP